MIQFYINSRPVPRAIARNRIEETFVFWTPADVNRMIRGAIVGDLKATKFIAEAGVSIHTT
jgi:hypothetical protein